jgi:hypothetical protein
MEAARQALAGRERAAREEPGALLAEVYNAIRIPAFAANAIRRNEAAKADPAAARAVKPAAKKAVLSGF